MQDYLQFHSDLDDLQTVSTYDELSLWSAMAGLLLLRHVPLSENMQALDVGCGAGFPLLELAQRLGPGCRVYGLDPWETALERARFKARLWGLTNVDIRTGDATAMPFTDGQFDLIVSNLGLNNFTDPAAALKECRRVLKPGGRLALATNLQGHMQEFYDVYAQTLVEMGLSERLNALQGHIAHRGTLASVQQLLADAGLTPGAVHQESVPMRFLNGSALLNHYFIKLGFLDAWKAVVPAEQQPAVFARLEENINRYAAQRGELRLTIPLAYLEGERCD